jgi:hypothetical protein
MKKYEFCQFLSYQSLSFSVQKVFSVPLWRNQMLFAMTSPSFNAMNPTNTLPITFRLA